MRTKHRLVFDMEREFMARRPFVLAGVSLNYEDPVDKTGIEERRLRNMYEARMIEVDPRTPAERAKAAERAASARKAAEAPTPAPGKKNAPEATPAPGGATPKARVERDANGFTFRVVNAAGETIKGGLKTKVAADRELKKHQ